MIEEKRRHDQRRKVEAVKKLGRIANGRPCRSPPGGNPRGRHQGTGATKACDYGFYVGGARKFYVEAKKPS